MTDPARATPRQRVAGLVRRFLGSRDRRLTVENLMFRLGALASLGLATVLLARTGGPIVVGHYALLRIVPWLLVMLLTIGYEGAIVYFLARADGPQRGTRATIVAIAITGGLVGALLWFVAAPLIASTLFDGLDVQLVRLAALLVPARAWVTVGRQSLQGTQDLRGSNINIVTEAAAFLPAYAVLLGLGFEGGAALVIGLIGGDIITLAVSWRRLWRNGFFVDIGRPSGERAAQLGSFGLRTNSGYLLQLLNLRLDVVLIGVLAGSATAGTYAIASRFAELILLVPHSVLYVLQPRYTELDRASAAAAARRVLRPVLGVTAVTALPIAVIAQFVLPIIYGQDFNDAIRPTQILLIGLIATGAGSVMTAYLYGDGRPGLVSVASGVGLATMVLTDIALIPALGAVGAAIASSASYLLSSTVLYLCFRSVMRPVLDAAGKRAASRDAEHEGAPEGGAHTRGSAAGGSHRSAATPTGT